ncbi:inactive serine/threonine-protein kinase/endoribonuclease IRE1-like [Eucalyptus grandis]|uniref:inactive serine/threonine-protein kinase/endoribonuclease IRE1-like n=1 Tax=Eucalyptus grandis TaxID=71139 RepID=UPI00192E9453|nr:inactive serine/threonine-protein kinase/endoribonuclease IRE1-like [Eucalyptus grandis]
MSMQKRPRMNNGDDFRNILVPSSPILSSDVISTVGASSSPDLPFSEKNLPDPSAAFSPESVSYIEALVHSPFDYYREPQNLSSVICQREFAAEDLTDMPEGWLADLPLSVNAEVEVSDTKAPQGNEGRIDNIRSNGDQLTKINSLLDGWSEIGKIAVSSTKIGEGSKGTIVYEGKYDGRLAAVKRLVRDCFDDVVSKEIDILIKADRHENIVRYYGVEKDRHFVYLALELCTCSLDDLIQVRLDSSNNSAYPRDPASTSDYKIKLDSVRGMMQDVNLWRADNYPSPQLMKLMRTPKINSHIFVFVVSLLTYVLHDSEASHRDHHLHVLFFAGSCGYQDLVEGLNSSPAKTSK